MSSTAATRWPSVLPTYLDRMDVRSGRVYVRLVQTSTVQLQLGGEHAGLPLMNAPLDGFRGCNAGGCLWLSSTDESARIHLVTPEEIDALASAAIARKPRSRLAVSW